MSTNHNPDSTNILLKAILSTLDAALMEHKKAVRFLEEWYYHPKPEKGQLLPAQQSVKQAKPPPAFLRAEHVAQVLCISHRSADRVLRQVRQQAGLAPRTPVSVQLFAEVKGIPVRDIIRIIAG
ncbi:hypothetical protein HNQ91_000417 [Filimonas zeae]|uniref:Uncharacterized protein n=1 Tax=Filimonas zeae TaxID=1737353 RepID=A0A917ILZ2_9BACT|nr:hypothetical protein [Filimonas zeae]MDR6337395.1 hypothetical protein [Filimonas zeae]GGH58405.1 hypothetical protein GCM10011379_04100 [Filimonas zeae]